VKAAKRRYKPTKRGRKADEKETFFEKERKTSSAAPKKETFDSTKGRKSRKGKNTTEKSTFHISRENFFLSLFHPLFISHTNTSIFRPRIFCATHTTKRCILRRVTRIPKLPRCRASPLGTSQCPACQWPRAGAASVPRVADLGASRASLSSSLSSRGRCPAWEWGWARGPVAGAVAPAVRPAGSAVACTLAAASRSWAGRWRHNANGKGRTCAASSFKGRASLASAAAFRMKTMALVGATLA